MRKPDKTVVTLDRLRSVLDYNPSTGKFYRAISPGFGKEVGSSHPAGYIKLGIDGVCYLAHRLAWFYVHGEWPADVIDHINGDKADNRISNLRAVTQRENMRAYFERMASEGDQA